MEYTTLLPIGPIQVSAAIKKIQFMVKYTTLSHIGPSQV